MVGNDSGALEQTCALPETVAVIYTVLNICLSGAASLGNVLILIAFHQVSSVHPPTKLLFRCLAVTDLLVGLITQPLFVITILSSVTKIHNIFYVSAAEAVSSLILCGASISTSTAISVDRLLALSLGIRYRQVVTLKRVSIVMACFWLICALVGLSSIFFNRDVMYTEASIYAILCVLISIFSHLKIFLKLRKHQARVQGNASEKQRNQIRVFFNITRYRKSVSSIAWIQLALVVCYIPFIVTVANEWSQQSVCIIWTSTGTLFYLKSSLNPVLYFWKIGEVRQEVKSIFRHVCSPWC